MYLLELLSRILGHVVAQLIEALRYTPEGRGIDFRGCRKNFSLAYRIFRPITCALSIQKGSEIVKNEHARYTLERFLTDNARIICTKKGIGKYGIMY